MKSKAVLFGLNYQYSDEGKLNGCINDVHNMANYLETELGIPCESYTDDVDRFNTSSVGILRKLYELAVDTYKNDLDFVWIHYSGHGTYIVDRSGDERDGKDEALVPSDYETAGFLQDDHIQHVFRLFNPKTQVVCVFDCCHSGTIGDVKYSWEGVRRVRIENILCAVSAKVITLSGCLDAQVSMDAHNVMGDKKYSGAMTSCVLMSLRENPALRKDVFALTESVRRKLKERGFEQIPLLCSSHNLAKHRAFVPL